MTLRKRRRKAGKRFVTPPKYIPTRKSIAAECERIQRRWTAKQETDRRLWAYVPPVEVEVASLGTLAGLLRS